MSPQINGQLEKLDITSVTKFQTEDWIYFLDIHLIGKRELSDGISYYIQGKGFTGAFNKDLKGYIKFQLNSNNDEPTPDAFEIMSKRKSLLSYNQLYNL